jgi:hypothetical protein
VLSGGAGKIFARISRRFFQEKGSAPGLASFQETQAEGQAFCLFVLQPFLQQEA